MNWWSNVIGSMDAQKPNITAIVSLDVTLNDKAGFAVPAERNSIPSSGTASEQTVTPETGGEAWGGATK